MTPFAFYGTFMRDQPGHGRLAEARFLEETRTASRYRLFFVDGLWPALVPSKQGVEIACELYDASEALLARLAEIEPPGWSRGPVELVDGRRVETFLGDPVLADRGADVSAFGGWAAYVRSPINRTP